MVQKLEEQAVDPAFSLMPIGSIILWAGGATLPTGWDSCDGSQYDPDDNPLLFAALGYTHGMAGSDFLIPDLTGEDPTDTVSGLSYLIKTGA